MSLRSHQIVALLLLGAAGDCLAQQKEPCLAYVLKADVTVLCQNATTQITHRRDIKSFAVSDERLSLAFVAQKVLRRNEASAIVASSATVVDLKKGTSKQVENVHGVISTCGTILWSQVGNQMRSRDLVTGADLIFGPYIHFRCSADRQIVFGITRDGPTKDHSALYVGTPPATRVAAGRDVDVRFFNVSPEGSRVAYLSDGHPLCIYSQQEGTQCVGGGSPTDPPSVDDSGAVLVAVGTGRGCVYKNSWDFSPAKPPSVGGDECLGIGFWKAGMKQIDVIVPLGRNPQWISPRTADLLRDWSKRANNGAPR